MIFQVVFSPSARRDLHGIPARVLLAIIESTYGDLAANPRRVGEPLGRELSGIYSARRGSYRILYDINDAPSHVAIMRVDHRADVYRPSKPMPTIAIAPFHTAR